MPLQPTRVLLVEDNPADVGLLRAALPRDQRNELVLASVETLEAGLKLLHNEPFDVALLDLSLPDAEGLEIVHAVGTAAPSLPVIVLTGRDDSALALRAVRDGAQDYLVKGRFDSDLLMRAIRYAIERKRSIDDLERREHHFRALIENATDIITVLDSEFKIKFVSPSVERILGFSPENVVGQDIAKLVHRDDFDTVRIAFQEAIDSPGQRRFADGRVRHIDGNWCWLESTVRSLFDDPVVAGLVINSHDITERKRASEALRGLNERLQAVIDNAPLAIFQVDLDGRVLEWNKGAERIYGWTAEEAIGHPLPTIPEDALDDFFESLKRSRMGAFLIEKDGTIIFVNLWTAPLRDDDGKIRAVMGMVADVTEHKRLEGQFRHAQKMEAVGQLAGGVAHDFNNLLTVITGYAQLAAKRLTSDSAAYAELQEVLAASERAASLTKQLLALSRRQVFEPVLLDINDVIAGTEKMVRRIAGDLVNVIVQFAPGLPPIRADRSQMELVLLNLAVNARDAMPGGGTLTIESARSSSGTAVLVRVRDTGAGMAPRIAARIFEPFFTTKEEGKGTGLGLSTSLGIVRQHGGDIRAESMPGRGTTFEISLPAADAITAAEPPETIAPDTRPASEVILLVEDQAEVADVMRAALATQGYTVLLAHGMSEAVSTARDYAGGIDLLLGDATITGIQNIEEEVRHFRPLIRVLLVADRANAARAHGRTASLQKPFAPEALARKVREVLREPQENEGD
jgi:PAS domain S-box-containing protein